MSNSRPALKLIVISMALLTNGCALDRGPGEVPRGKSGDLIATQEWFYGDDCKWPRSARIITDEYISDLQASSIEWSADSWVTIEKAEFRVGKTVIDRSSATAKIRIEDALKMTVRVWVTVSSDAPMGERKIYGRLRGRNLGMPCRDETFGQMTYLPPDTLALTITVPAEGLRAWGNWLGRLVGLLVGVVLGLVLLFAIVAGIFDWIKKEVDLPVKSVQPFSLYRAL